MSDGTPLAIGVLGALAIGTGLRRGSRAGHAPTRQRCIGLNPSKIRFTIADLSCGAGMASRGVIDGLTAYGFQCEVLAAVDPWEAAVNSYRCNVPEAVPGAIMKIKTEEALSRGLVPPVDLVITGPPCIRDSTLARCRLDELKDISQQMAGIKEAARKIGEASAPMVAIETNRGWGSWGRSHGYSVTKVHDDRLGGFTMRKREFLLKGIDVCPPTNPWRSSWSTALPEWGSIPGIVSTAGTFNKKKRRFRQRAPSQVGYAVPGSGATTLIYREGTGDCIHRCTPQEQACLQGFPGLHLMSSLVRDQNSLVGNGWTRSYGLWLARCIASTLGVVAT